jgi:uncharacterized RDD family membrane protein YckC
VSKGYGKVSGHYAGVFTRLAAFIIDWFFILAVYGLILGAAQFVLNTFFGQQVDYAEAGVVWIAGFLLFSFLYLAGSLTITGRTVGKGLVGLKVVTRRGAPVTGGRAAVRALVFPLSVLIPLAFVGILLGRERRALHDVIAGTAVVYDWGDRPAEMPAPMTRWLEQKGVQVRAGEAQLHAADGAQDSESARG